jgi:nucleoside-diphosphate-sugar epimerase
VTGAAGFIGRRVVARLAGAGAKVVALDRLPQPAGFPAGVEYIRGELNEFPAVEKGYILVHLAWNMDRADPKAQAASAADFIRLLGIQDWHGVVGLGSAEEYGEREGRLSEHMAPGHKLSAYGQAKSEACQALAAWAREPGRHAVWLRPFIAYGPGQRGSMAIPYARQCVQARQRAEFSEGGQRRDFVHVDDVAEGIAQAALRVAELETPFAICNLGCGVPVRLRDVLERIALKTGAQDRFVFGARPMRANEPKEQYADVAAAGRWLGWRARISWEQGIDAMCQGYEKDNHG